MTIKNIVFIIITFLIISITNAQDYSFGKVSLDDLKNKTYDKDSTANAVILHKSRKTYFKEKLDGYVVITEIYERIKILKEEGLGYGVKEIVLYKEEGDRELVSYIIGNTFNEEKGKIKLDSLKKKDVLKNELSKNWSNILLTLPNIKVGSIVEWSYTISSPFWRIDDLIIQENIPTAHYYAKITTPFNFSFNSVTKGPFKISPREYKELNKLKVNKKKSKHKNQNNSIKNSFRPTKGFVSEYNLKNIPALKEEHYVDNIENYRSSVIFQLKSIEFPYNELVNYSMSWESVFKNISKSKRFGKQIRSTKFIKELVKGLNIIDTSQIKIANTVFNYVKRKMNWNGHYGYFTDKGIVKAYNQSLGNIAEINLFLVALLRQFGLDANPVLVSTRDYGVPNFPSLEGFNYVIASVKIDKTDILLDATDKLHAFGILPEHALHWKGALISGHKRIKEISLYPKTINKKSIVISVKLNKDGSLEGRQRTTFTNNMALKYRKNAKQTSKNAYIRTLVDTLKLDQIHGFEVKNLLDITKPVIEYFSFKIYKGVEITGNEINLFPLFFLRLKSNPFQFEKRTAPINFTYPRHLKQMINIEIPEGYKIKSLPKPINLSLPNGMGSFLFNISEIDNKISVVTNFKINSAIIPVKNYLELRTLFLQRLKKESEKIVLIKI